MSKEFNQWLDDFVEEKGIDLTATVKKHDSGETTTVQELLDIARQLPERRWKMLQSAAKGMLERADTTDDIVRMGPFILALNEEGLLS